jgi:carbon storage regulator CsrA
MLVLTRKTGERTVIAGLSTIEVLKAQGKRVQLAIRAPRNVAIRLRRQELAPREAREPVAREGDPGLTGQGPPGPCPGGPRHP